MGETVLEHGEIRRFSERERVGKRTQSLTKRSQAAADGERHFKASGGTVCEKRAVIIANQHKYSTAAMCKVLKLPRSTFYYKEKPEILDTKLESAVCEEFKKSRNNYGARKLKVVLKRRGFNVSRRRIGKIMKRNGLISNYTLRRKNRKKSDVNEAQIENSLARNFNGKQKFEVVVSDLTYVKISGKWRYICLLVDLFGRKIIGSAVGNQHNSRLVESAFYSVQSDLRLIEKFHTDRGSEFKNKVIEDILETFKIERSLSAKGTPHDNAVAESMYNILKTEFIFGQDFADLDELKLYLFDFINWYNNVRVHGSLGYITPNQWHSLA
ncbi:MAG: IS3 family transposase [Eubacterium sp.]|jgi:transposase InsO family protein|nr:IS3 family transposase [Eubacterium sp.]